MYMIGEKGSQYSAEMMITYFGLSEMSFEEDVPVKIRNTCLRRNWQYRYIKEAGRHVRMYL